jgi:ribonuclease VapC
MLAWLFREPGGEHVEAVLPAIISAVNLTEVIIVGVRRGLTAEAVQAALLDLPITVIPFERTDAPAVAVLHAEIRKTGLSLADCICISLGARFRLPVLTADTRWAEVELPAQIRLIR